MQQDRVVGAKDRILTSLRRLAVAAVLAVLTIRAAAQPGEILPKWTAGTLDIHHINTGLGNAAFLMLPDGTTMLIDAGHRQNVPPRATPPKPNGSRPPGEWIARYVTAMGATAIDYGYLTPFHDDHMNALVDVAQRVPMRTMIDRGFPDYSYPSTDHAEFAAPAFRAYRDYLNKGTTKGERLAPGRNDQIVLRHTREKYPDFEIRNVSA